MIFRRLLFPAFLVVLGPHHRGQELVPRFGFYTDQPSYAPGDTIRIFGDWEPASGSSTVRVKYRLARIEAGGVQTVGAETPVFLYRGDQPQHFGSFVEYPRGLDLAGRLGFTLEGWIQPTLLGDTSDAFPDDWVAIAGQLACPTCPQWSAGQPFPVRGTAGLGLSADGELFAFVNTVDSGPTSVVSAAQLDVRGANGAPSWYYVAATYDGAELRVLVGDEQGWLAVDETPASGRIRRAPGHLPFRIGSRAEDVGDRRGGFDGRLDSWSVWAAPLSRARLDQRRRAKQEDAFLASWSRGAPRDVADAGGGEGEGGDGRASSLLLMTALFEDGYGTVVRDGSPNGFHGRLVNHGTPGMAGRTPGGQALRLNHDQVVDARWSSFAELESSGALAAVEIDVPSTPQVARSGFYAVQAQIDDGAGFDPADRTAERWQSLVVRPAASAGAAPVAVVVPVNTWIAYNAWPGAIFQRRSAQGIAPVGGFLQGNNSAYFGLAWLHRMGDGESTAHYVGWRRPNVKASPFLPAGQTLSFLAPMSRLFFEWLDGLAAPAVPYDAYTDWDLDDGTLDPREYSTIVTIAHHEYWSERALRVLNQFTAGDPDAAPPIAAGGSLINLAGNLFAWRSEVDRQRGVIEVKKWPSHLELTGAKDKESLMGGGPTGYWRYVLQCASPARTDDHVLGTMSEVVVPCTGPPACFGAWRVKAPGHFLWDGAGVVANQLVAPQTVGHEMDVFDPRFPPPGSGVTVLASGTDFGNGLAIDFDHRSFDPANCAELDAEATGDPLTSYWFSNRMSSFGPSAEHGTILYYRHAGGGHVLSVASTATVLGITQDPALARLAHNAFRCFALGQGCP